MVPEGEIDMAELKPCPWPECKNSNKDWLYVVQRDFFGEPMYQVRCHNCGATGPLDIDADQAISAWNRRNK